MNEGFLRREEFEWIWRTKSKQSGDLVPFLSMSPETFNIVLFIHTIFNPFKNCFLRMLRSRSCQNEQGGPKRNIFSGEFFEQGSFPHDFIIKQTRTFMKCYFLFWWSFNIFLSVLFYRDIFLLQFPG